MAESVRKALARLGLQPWPRTALSYHQPAPESSPLDRELFRYRRGLPVIYHTPLGYTI